MTERTRLVGNAVYGWLLLLLPAAVLLAAVAEQALHPGPAEDVGPYARIVRPPSAVFCGDFNMESDSEEFAALLASFDGSVPGLVDAWPALHPGRPHDPTCGVFDQRQWPAGAHCRDFFLVTEELQSRLRSLRVDLRTDASDHQPVVLVLSDGLGACPR